MTGEVWVRWTPSALWLPRWTGPGRLPVVIDGVRAAEIGGWGGSVRVSLPVGSHTLRVGRPWARSNTVTVTVVEGGCERLVVRRVPFLSFGFGLAGYGLGYVAFHADMVVVAALFAALAGIAAIPGVSWRLREGNGPLWRSLASAEAREDRWVDAASSASAGNGLWWESDPRFAKRFGTSK